ncbi:RHS repeat domain-containing protein [Streptomyces sp. NPDC002763]|uniref:RHS repeat domain-containing protein n=1 Tax=Streptomyces sp. NPDC002763 TaxID=3154427 RepID=UPI003326C6B1
MPSAPYWHSYAYDGLGNCKTDVDHATTAGGSDTSTSYVYPPQGGIQPHTLSSSTKGSTTNTNSHTYDGAGNTHTRTPDGKTRTLERDSEGHLAKVTNADGNRLLSRGHAVLHLGRSDQRGAHERGWPPAAGHGRPRHRRDRAGRDDSDADPASPRPVRQRPGHPAEFWFPAG